MTSDTSFSLPLDVRTAPSIPCWRSPGIARRFLLATNPSDEDVSVHVDGGADGRGALLLRDQRWPLVAGYAWIRADDSFGTAWVRVCSASWAMRCASLRLVAGSTSSS